MVLALPLRLLLWVCAGLVGVVGVVDAAAVVRVADVVFAVVLGEGVVCVFCCSCCWYGFGRSC